MHTYAVPFRCKDYRVILGPLGLMVEVQALILLFCCRSNLEIPAGLSIVDQTFFLSCYVVEPEISNWAFEQKRRLIFATVYYTTGTQL